MNYISPLIVGFLAAFIGLLAPSMLNMTAAKTSIKKGKKAGIQFATGAASVVIIQAFIAVYFAKYLVKNPAVITKLKTAAIFILLILSIFFFMQARKKFKAEGKNKKGNNYLIGLGMSSLNMLAIPFYLTMATLAEKNGWMKIEQPFSLIYVIGAVFGAFSLFSIYAIFAKKIAEKAQFIAQNINYILSLLFVFLALLVVYEVYLN
ncbi:MAG: LysE family transporter [Flavobacteriaceae bacterium]|nr:LysE family transporter [Flavobacteriaceae bacterium]